MSIRAFLAASSLISIGLLVGRLLGLLREMLLAAQFGSGSEANMAIALLIVPDFITAALIGSALSATLLPAFAARDDKRLLALFWQTMWASIVFFSVLGVIIALFIPTTDYSNALLLALCSLPFTAATAVFTTYLQHRGRFAVPAFANAIFNCIILATLWFAPNGLLILASGVIVAAIARLLAHAFAFLRAGGRYQVTDTKSWELRRPLLISYLHTSGASLLGVLPQYVPYAVVALFSVSGFAVFNYAFKLLVFPAVMIQTIIQLVLLPWFVRQRTESATLPAERYSTSLQLGWIISFAVSLAVCLAGQAIAAVCFDYGRMTADDVREVGQLLSIGIWATPGAVLLTIWQQMLYAHEQPRPVFTANIALVAMLVVFCSAGVMMAGAPGALAGFVLAQTLPVWLLARAAKDHTGLTTRPSRSYFVMSAACLIAFAPLAALYHFAAATPLMGVVLALAIGMVSLLAGLYACEPFRKKLHEATRHRIRLDR